MAQSATIEEISDSAPEQQQQNQVPDLNALLAGAGANIDDDDDEDADVSVTDKITSRAERKSRKSLQGIGLKKIAGVNRVTMRRPRGHLYVIAEPEVYKSSTTDCYIIFGESKAEDMSAQHQAQAAQQQQQQQAQAAAMQAQLAKLGAGADAGKGKEEEEEDDGEEIDETGVDPKDIELVIQQVGCSRRKAVKSLKESDGDLINAIMAAS